MSEKNIGERRLDDLHWIEKEGLNNYGILTGRLQGEFQYSHRFCRQSYYKTRIKVKRKSGTIDIIPVVISGDTLGNLRNKELKGRNVTVTGQICTYDVHDQFTGEHYLCICFSADNIIESDEQEEENNVIYLKGALCKRPFVKTKYSGQKVVEMFIAVRRKDGKKDYIPCVSWNPIASCIENEFSVGDKIELQGRFQSRRYFKKYNRYSEQGEYRTTYEVAIAQVF